MPSHYIVLTFKCSRKDATAALVKALIRVSAALTANRLLGEKQDYLTNQDPAYIPWYLWKIPIAHYAPTREYSPCAGYLRILHHLRCLCRSAYWLLSRQSLKWTAPPSTRAETRIRRDNALWRVSLTTFLNEHAPQRWLPGDQPNPNSTSTITISISISITISILDAIVSLQNSHEQYMIRK